MNDQWYDFWVTQGAGYQNGVNLRPDTYDYKKYAEYLNTMLHFKPTDHVLDVGCGNGMTIREIATYTKFISGVDYSGNMVQLAKNIAIKNHLTGDYHETPAEDLSVFKTGMFDKIVCAAVLQYYSTVEQAKVAVREMLRVCKKGGEVFIADIPEAEKIKSAVSGFCVFSRNDFGEYMHKYMDSYYEPHRRFDILITKQ